MNKTDIRNAVLTNLAAQGTKYVPAGVSARHVHLCQADMEKLFGAGHSLSAWKPLSQPGQFASEERVTVVGPRDAIANVRVLGPVRPETQVEMAFSDLMRLGIKAVVRMSGNIAGTPGCVIKGPAGEITIPQGVIVAARHLHLGPSQALGYGLKDGDTVSVHMDGVRSCIMEQVICRVGEKHELELHIDTDEANSAAIQTGDLLRIISGDGCSGKGTCKGDCKSCAGKGAEASGSALKAAVFEAAPLDLVTEKEVNEAYKRGCKEIRCASRAIVTPAARDRAGTLEIIIKK